MCVCESEREREREREKSERREKRERGEREERERERMIISQCNLTNSRNNQRSDSVEHLVCDLLM